MKTIELKKEKENVVVQGREVEIELSTADLLKTALNSPVQGGYSINDISIRVRLLDLVSKSEKANSSLELEDADFNSLSEIVQGARWAVVSRFIKDFVEQF